MNACYRIRFALKAHAKYMAAMVLPIFLWFSPMQVHALSWSPSNGPTGGTVSTVVIDPVTTTTLYAGTIDGGVFKSTDAGSSWIAINTGLTSIRVIGIAIDPVTPAIIYAATADGILGQPLQTSILLPLTLLLPTHFMSEGYLEEAYSRVLMEAQTGSISQVRRCLPLLLILLQLLRSMLGHLVTIY